jgi:hypothetical protein
LFPVSPVQHYSSTGQAYFHAKKFDRAKRLITVRMGHNWYRNQLCPRKVMALTEESSIATFMRRPEGNHQEATEGSWRRESLGTPTAGTVL